MEIAFFLFVSMIAVASAVSVVVSRNTVHSALLMVTNLFCIAVLYLSLAAEFLAVVQITVYAGAIMVLFLFVITMLNPSQEESPNRLVNRLPAAVALALAFLVGISLVLKPEVVDRKVSLPPGWVAPGAANLEAVGTTLFTQYLLPFELTSLLLLVGMVAAIVLAKKRT